MKEFFLKLAARWLAGIDSAQFERICLWVTEVGRDPDFQDGFAQAQRVVSLYNSNYAETASWIVKTVVQLAYATAKLRGEDT